MIIIDQINNIIQNIPSILSYVIYGYVYLTAYYWISFKDNKSFENFLIKSIAVSFIIKTVVILISTQANLVFLSPEIEVIVCLLISAISGLAIGKLISHRMFNEILHKLHMGRTTNSNILDDVIKPYVWLRVYMNDGSSYLGQYRYGEEFKSEPIIVLANYQKLNKDAEIVLDYSNSSNELIMINTKDFDRIEITYNN